MCVCVCVCGWVCVKENDRQCVWTSTFVYT